MKKDLKTWLDENQKFLVDIITSDYIINKLKFSQKDIDNLVTKGYLKKSKVLGFYNY